MTNWFLTADEAREVAYIAAECVCMDDVLIKDCREALDNASKQFDAVRAAAYTPRRDFFYDTIRSALDELDVNTGDKVAAVRRLTHSLGCEISETAGSLGNEVGRLADALSALNLDDSKFRRFINSAFDNEAEATTLTAETKEQRVQNCAVIVAMAREGRLSLIDKDITPDSVAHMLVYADGYRALQKAERAGDIAAGAAKVIVAVGLLAWSAVCYLSIFTLGFMAAEASYYLGIFVMTLLWCFGSASLLALDDSDDGVFAFLTNAISPVLRRIGIMLGSSELAQYGAEAASVQVTVADYDDQTVKQYVQATVQS